MNKEEKEKLVSSYNAWWHSIDFGDGVKSQGRKGGQGVAHIVLENELKKWFPTDFFTGNRVLDVGAWDGFFSFYAENNGAKEVVAVDGFIWKRSTSDNNISSKRGFDIGKQIFNSKVKDYIQDITEPCKEKLGTFDSIIFAGVLYHLIHPMKAVEVLDTLVNPNGRIMLETTTANNDMNKPMMQFHPKKSFANDPTNYWSPNVQCVIDMFNEIGSYTVDSQNHDGHRAWMVLRKNK